MVTIIDLSTAKSEQLLYARQLSSHLEQLHHENLMVLTQPVSFASTHVQDALWVFTTEAPDHRLSWKMLSR